MDELDEFHKKIQMFLMKKNQEYGELRFMTSRTTPENEKHIDDVCASILDIFHTCNIHTGQDDLINNDKCVQAYKYLLLNTNFNNQERLAEDIVNGHLVDMCPPLSPYLFIQILWKIKYEVILVESLLHLPIDLCTEVLEIIRSCIDQLDFEQSNRVMYQLILNVYIKFLKLKETGCQSNDLPKSIENLMINFQELLLLLSDTKLLRLTGVSRLKKYERYGKTLKQLLHTVKTCLEYNEAPISVDHEKLYKISFGKEAFTKCDNTLLETTINTLNQELLELLLKKIKEIDCNIYFGWVELDDEHNSSISLQRSIGNDCYYFIEFMKKDEQLSQEAHVIECLQQFSSKPESIESVFVLSLPELYHAITDGKKEHMKELMRRYKEWDRSTIDFIFKNKSLLDKEDCSSLLKYLTFIVKQSEQEELKQASYLTITRILSLQTIPDIYEIVMEYVMRHDGKNTLEFEHTEEMFNNFIRKNANLRTPTNLRIILLFLLKNLKMVLNILVKITIGHPDYGNIMISPNDLLLLSSFMRIREENNQTLLSNILKSICMENQEWNVKKFMDFIRVMLDSSVLKADDLMNNVFIPYLEGDSLNVSNINSILNNIRKLQNRCTKNMKMKSLVVALAKRMNFLRKSTSIAKYISNEILAHITRILEYFLEFRINRVSSDTRKEIIDGIEAIIEPIDKLYFASLWHLTKKGVHVIDIIEDYERRCLVVVNRLKADPKTSEKSRNYLSNLSLLREDFVRHLIIRCTESEYHSIGSELTLMYWYIFCWTDELDAYDQFLRLTMEACCLSLEYPSVGGNDLFVFLLKSFLKFCKLFVRLEGVRNTDEVHHLLIKNVNLLSESIKHTPFGDLFIAFLTRLNNDVQYDSAHRLQEVLTMFDHFTNQCFELDHERPVERSDSPRSPKISHFYETHEIISACLKVPATEAYECIRRMNELFTTK